MESIDYELLWNRKVFIDTLRDLMEFLNDKSVEIIKKDDHISDSDKHKHAKLQKTCIEIKSELEKDIKTSELDLERFIKKIYKTISSNLDKIVGEELDATIFSLTNAEGKQIFIIPSIDLDFIYKLINDNEKKVLWRNVLLIYVSCVKMISVVNKQKQIGKIYESLEKIEKKIIEYGIDKVKFTNPYVEITKSEEFGTDIVFEKTGGAYKPKSEDDIKEAVVEKLIASDMAKSLGINGDGIKTGGAGDKLFSKVLEQVKGQLKTIKMEDVTKATDNFFKAMGINEGDSTHSMLTGIVGDVTDELRNTDLNSLSDIVGVVKKVGNKMGNKLDPEKLRRSANQFAKMAKHKEKFMKNLKEMKDENGKPLCPEGIEKLSGPMKLMENFVKNMEHGGKSKKQHEKEVIDELVQDINNTDYSKASSSVVSETTNTREPQTDIQTEPCKKKRKNKHKKTTHTKTKE